MNRLISSFIKCGQQQKTEVKKDIDIELKELNRPYKSSEHVIVNVLERPCKGDM